MRGLVLIIPWFTERIRWTDVGYLAERFGSLQILILCSSVSSGFLGEIDLICGILHCHEEDTQMNVRREILGFLRG